VDKGVLFVEVSLLQSDKPHSVVLLRTSNRPVAGTSNRKYTTLTRDTDRHSCPRWDWKPQSQQAKLPQTHASDRTATWIGQETAYSRSTDLCDVIKLLSVIDNRHFVRSAGPLEFFSHALQICSHKKINLQFFVVQIHLPNQWKEVLPSKYFDKSFGIINEFLKFLRKHFDDSGLNFCFCQ
jgi:hypothetical protein